MTGQRNPWVQRFEALSAEEITKRLGVQPEPLTLSAYDLEAACDQLARRLEAVFVADAQSVEIAESLYLRARAHSAAVYDDRAEYLRRCYAQDPNLPDSVVPTYLTGLAGSGKTRLSQRVAQLLPKPTVIEVNSSHPALTLESSWLVSVRSDTTTKRVLQQILSRYLEALPKTTSELLDLCRHCAYQRGISLLIIDELQFMTGSAGANTQIAVMLKTLAGIGVPMLYIGNFSLGYRLSRRPQEDVERLLLDPLVVLPPTADSQDWQRTVEGLQAVAPEDLTFDPAEMARPLHVWTGGLKRHLRWLMLHAYRRARRARARVDAQTLEAAYASMSYATQRQTVKELARLGVTGRTRTPSLDCPFPLPPSDVAESRRRAREDYDAELQAANIEASLTAEERVRLKEMRVSAARTGGKPPSTRARGRRRSDEDRMNEFRQGEEHLKSGGTGK